MKSSITQLFNIVRMHIALKIESPFDVEELMQRVTSKLEHPKLFGSGFYGLEVNKNKFKFFYAGPVFLRSHVLEIKGYIETKNCGSQVTLTISSSKFMLVPFILFGVGLAFYQLSNTFSLQAVGKALLLILIPCVICYANYWHDTCSAKEKLSHIIGKGIRRTGRL